MMANGNNKGLGRSFDSLIPSEIIEVVTSTGTGEAGEGGVNSLLIVDIKPNPNQPRRDFDEDALRSLSESIAAHGVIQPVVVIDDEVSGGYHLVAGERRWRAAQLAGLEKIPAIVRTLDEQARLEVALIENLQREDLNPLEVAIALEALIDQFSLAHEQIAERIGKATSTVKNILRLVNLPEEAKQALRDGSISEGHARSILALQDYPADQAELLEYIRRFGWSVRQAERFAAQRKAAAKGEPQESKVKSETNRETEAISKWLGTPVKVRRTGRGGSLVIRFTSKEQYERITKALMMESPAEPAPKKKKSKKR